MMSPIFSSRTAVALLTASLLAANFAASGAQAADEGEQAIDLGIGQAIVVHLPRPAADVVIGNPAIADVTVQNPTTVMVFGRRAGGTTLSVLDHSGHPLVQAPVLVGSGGPGSVAVTLASGNGVKQPGGHVVNWVCGGFTCVRMEEGGSGGGASPATAAK